MEQEDKERFKNIAIFKVPLTDKEMEDGLKDGCFMPFIVLISFSITIVLLSLQ